jgi:hypothetical protein
MSDEVTTGGDSIGNSGAAAREEGTALLRQGQFREAAEALRRAVAADPNDESSWRLLGGALASGGDADGAVEAFERAVEINPGSAKNHYNAAVALQGVGRIVEARAAIAEALVLDPNYQQAQARQRELNDLISDGTSGYDISSSPTSPPVPPPSYAASTESRIPPPPPPGGYAPLPPMPPGGYRPPTPNSSYTPNVGGGYPPPQGGYPPQGAQGDYAPPPVPGQSYGMAAPPVNGTTVLVLGIVGLLCVHILGPVAWIMGNNALKTLDQYPYADQSQRSTVVAGRIIGMITTGILALDVIYLFFVIISALSSGGR